jgi:hypothetical protein
MSDETPAEPTPEVDEPTTFDAEYVAKLRKEAAGYRSQVKELRPLADKARELEESQKSEVEKATARAAEAEARAAALERNAARDRIAREKGLADFAEFLTGDTDDDITAAADRLAALIPPRPPGRPVETLQPGNTPPAAASTSSPDDWIRQAVSARHAGR